MMPVGSSLWRSAFYLCLPAIAVFALAVYFLATDIPEMQREEQMRFEADLKREADALESPDASEPLFIWKRGEGIVKGDTSWATEFPADATWKSLKPAEGTKSKDMWGKRETARGLLVWKRSTGKDDSLVYAAIAEAELSERSTVVFVFASVFLAVLLFMTVVGVKYFIDYVKTRDDFMAATAHDLTTPLVGMRMMIGRNEAEASSLCERMIRLVANIKDFMRLGGRRAAPNAEVFDLVKAYEEAYSLFREDYRDIFDGADVILKRGEGVPSEGPVMVKADETLTIQILWNLLGNDLKYAAPYGNVEVRISAARGNVKIEFIDEGQGMTPGEMRRAFDRYYRAKTVLVSGKGGFGIGLSTAKEFAEAMGGSLTVAANEPKGCVFAFTLPMPKQPL